MTQVKVWPHTANLQTLNLAQLAPFTEGENKVTELGGGKSKTRFPSLGRAEFYHVASREHKLLGLFLVSIFLMAITKTRFELDVT